MSAAHFLSIRLRIAMDQTRGEDYISKKETEASIRRVMGDNKTGLPVGSFVRRGLEKKTSAERTIDRNELREVVRGNLKAFRNNRKQYSIKLLAFGTFLTAIRTKLE